VSESSFREVIKKAIEEYNKYRSPEIVAKLTSVSKRSFKVEFTGPFCLTCGFYDYFDDFKIVLEEYGLRVRVEEIEELGDGAVVKFTRVFNSDN